MERILLVDDDHNLAQLLTTILQLANYETVTARTVEEGKICLQTDTVALILLDLKLGSEDGRDLFRWARHAGYTRPFLIVSAHGAKSAARELGAEDWVEKPFEPDLLLRKITRLFSLAGAVK